MCGRTSARTALCFFNQLILFSCIWMLPYSSTSIRNASFNFYSAQETTASTHTDTETRIYVKCHKTKALNNFTWRMFVCMQIKSIGKGSTPYMLWVPFVIVLCSLFARPRSYKLLNSIAFIEHSISWLILCMSRVFNTRLLSPGLCRFHFDTAFVSPYLCHAFHIIIICEQYARNSRPWFEYSFLQVFFFSLVITMVRIGL